MKKDKSDDRPNHSGSTAAEDQDLSLWLDRLWARGEPPERIELYQMYNRNTRGEMIFHEDFKPGEKRNIEQANKLGNEIMAAAQNDCDSLRKEASYQIAVIDRNRRASPLVRRVGPLQPKRTYTLKTLNQVDSEVDDEETLNAQALSLRHIKEGFDQIRWEKQHNSRVVDGMLLLQDNIIKNQQATIDRLLDRVLTSHEREQAAEDRKAQRDVLLEKERFKIGLMRDGARTARNLLPALFGGTETGNSETPSIATNGHNAGANGNNTNGPKDYGSSRERTLTDNFLNDCEEEKLDIVLFGDCEMKDGKMVVVKPGIFTMKQFYALAGVRAGRLPVNALDDLLPESGHENAITQEQITAAGNAGVTEGMGSALLEIVNMRRQARELKKASTNGDATDETSQP